ncbi:MAG: hypothetical protein D6746_07135 [Bacteroidetes bacterium]|nr:MAG: hypothetical protein D6746_07135 [Bacteroidota bacterium]
MKVVQTIKHTSATEFIISHGFLDFSVTVMPWMSKEEVLAATTRSWLQACLQGQQLELAEVANKVAHLTKGSPVILWRNVLLEPYQMQQIDEDIYYIALPRHGKSMTPGIITRLPLKGLKRVATNIYKKV